MKKIKYQVTITMPKCDLLGHGEKYLQEVIQSDLDIEDKGRWGVEVKELEETKECEAMPDYWEKLKHQAAISAMQGLLSNSVYLESFVKYCVKGDHLARVVSRNAIDYATILIDKLKEEEK